MTQQYIQKNIKDFNTDHIFDCGQCFRWTRQEDGSYTGIAYGKPVNIQLSEDGSLIIDNSTKEDFDKTWKAYLDLDRDYGEIKSVLTEADPIIKSAVDYGSGIRILKQDLWETMVSFIISQNNNIPRIKGCIENLCAAFGEYAGTYNEKDYFNIPAPEKLAELSVGDLAPIRLGYRAPYLIKTARQVIEAGGPEAVAAELAQSSDAASDLCRFQGVGPKVANCIALFGAGRCDAFPIDVWVRRVMNRLYGIDEGDMKAMAVYAAEHFGQLGGFAQQYLFYYIRSLG